MGFGSTAKTLQRVADMAEDVYARLNDVREQLTEMRSTVRATDDRVARLELEVAEQRAILEALAQEEGIDVEGVTADIHIEEAEAASRAADDREISDDRTEGADGTGDVDGTRGDTDGRPPRDV